MTGHPRNEAPGPGLKLFNQSYQRDHTGTRRSQGIKFCGIFGLGAQTPNRKGQLYVIGGNTFDTTAREFKVRSDIFIFPGMLTTSTVPRRARACSAPSRASACPSTSSAAMHLASLPTTPASRFLLQHAHVGNRSALQHVCRHRQPRGLHLGPGGAGRSKVFPRALDCLDALYL